jgi:hypothetical protein
MMVKVVRRMVGGWRIECLYLFSVTAKIFFLIRRPLLGKSKLEPKPTVYSVRKCPLWSVVGLHLSLICLSTIHVLIPPLFQQGNF